MIMEQLSLDAQEPAIGVERRLHVPFLILLQTIGQKVFVSVLDPLDRRAEDQRCCRYGETFRMKRSLRTKSATDVGGHDADLRFGEAKRRNDNGLAAVRHLGRLPDGQHVLILVVGRDEPAWLDGVAPSLGKS